MWYLIRKDYFETLKPLLQIPLCRAPLPRFVECCRAVSQNEQQVLQSAVGYFVLCCCSYSFLPSWLFFRAIALLLASQKKLFLNPVLLPARGNETQSGSGHVCSIISPWVNCLLFRKASLDTPRMFVFRLCLLLLLKVRMCEFSVHTNPTRVVYVNIWCYGLASSNLLM